MTRHVFAYMRASTDEQDASRAKDELVNWAESKGVTVNEWFTENATGTTAKRPELRRLIDKARSGDVLLIEKVDRLTRLPWSEWQDLKAELKGIAIVCVDQPMTHPSLYEGDAGAENPIQQALTSFMLDLGAAMARDDYETRVKRQRQGIASAKAEGKYKGRKVDAELQQRVIACLEAGMSWSATQEAVGCSRATVAKAAKAIKDAAL